MSEPLTLTGVGIMALAEGVKFLYSEATEALKLWRAKKARQAATSSPPSSADEPPANLRTVPPVFAGEVKPGTPDIAKVDKLNEELASARKDVADLVDGIETIETQNAGQLAKIDALRRLVEVAYGQRITFKGENRAPSGPMVTGDVDVDELKAYAAGVRVKSVRSGKVAGSARAKKVDGGGQLFGVDAGDIG